MVTRTEGEANTAAQQFAVQGSAPSTPAANFIKEYFKSDGLYWVDENGLVNQSVVMDPQSLSYNTIQPTGGDYTPLTLRGYATAPAQPIFVVKEGSVGTNALYVASDGSITIGGNAVSTDYDLALVGAGVLMLIETTTPTADTGYGKLYWKNDNKLYGQDGAGEEHTIHGFPTWKSYTVTTQGLGASPDIYAGGFYEFNVADANLTQASTTQTFGTANVSYAAHAFVVAGAAGTVDTGVIGLRVNGTSITDAGVRTTSDTETIIADITAVVTDEYAESTKKWLGTVTFELFIVSGAPTTYSIDVNYGLAKYDDFGNNDFTVTDVEIVGFAGGNDSAVDAKLIHHRATGWTYSAGAFSPITAANTIASMATDHSTDDQVASSIHFAWKRSGGVSEDIIGSNSEGVMVLLSTTSINSIEYANVHIGVEY